MIFCPQFFFVNLNHAGAFALGFILLQRQKKQVKLAAPGPDPTQASMGQSETSPGADPMTP